MLTVNGVCGVCLQAVLQQQSSTRYIDELLMEAGIHHGRRRGCLFRRCGRRGRLGERSALDLSVLYGPQLVLIMVPMAGLERVLCCLPAVPCVYRRSLATTGLRHGDGPLGASVWPCVGPLH